MNYVSYTTWVEDNMVPVAVLDDVMIIGVKMEGMVPMIQKKYLSLVEKCLSEAAEAPMRVRILGKKEAEKVVDRKNDQAGEDDELRLNPKYTFENFVVGGGNRFAHAAALAVAESPAEAYNPLFIYGGVGLGKTHLMQAIGHFIHRSDPNKKILYMTSEQFTNELISAIQQKKTFEFRERIRNVDVLMVDDIQFIAGRESTQQEFFNTFNELHNNNKQIVLTSDKPPKDIQRLEERLCSRFEWGLVADIQRPDIDTRVAILREKTQQEHIQVPDDVLQLIAGKIDSNIRELEGCLTRLVAYSSLTGRPVDRALAEEALKEIFARSEPRRVTCDDVMDAVAACYSVTVDDLKGPRRNREVAVPRQIAMYIAREIVGAPLTMIGSSFGGRDHSTVNHACQKVALEMKTSPALNTLVGDLMQQLQER